MGSLDQDIFTTVMAVTMVLLLLLGFIVSFIFIYNKRQIRHKIEMSLVKERYTQEILQTELEIKEQTLKNLSEEIHDNVGQVLSLAILNLSAIDLNDHDKAAIKIERITGLVEKAIADLRNLAKTMDAETIADTGLAVFVRLELDMLAKTGVYQTSFSLTGKERRLEGSREIVLYRMVQESINNIVKHSRATDIKIDMEYQEDGLVISIADNGKGFDMNNLSGRDIQKAGTGLKNMKNRASIIKASIDISSVILSGTRVKITVPFDV